MMTYYSTRGGGVRSRTLFRLMLNKEKKRKEKKNGWRKDKLKLMSFEASLLKSCTCRFCLFKDGAY